jgi:hypothetical protein
MEVFGKWHFFRYGNIEAKKVFFETSATAKVEVEVRMPTIWKFDLRYFWLTVRDDGTSKHFHVTLDVSLLWWQRGWVLTTVQARPGPLLKQGWGDSTLKTYSYFCCKFNLIFAKNRALFCTFLLFPYVRKRYCDHALNNGLVYVWYSDEASILAPVF